MADANIVVELTNKELASNLWMIHNVAKLSRESAGMIELAVERLEAMPDASSAVSAMKLAQPILRSARKQAWDGAYEAETAVEQALSAQPQQPAPEKSDGAKKAWDKFQSLLSDDDPALSDKERIKRYCLEFCRYLSKRGVLCSMFGPEKLAEQFWQQKSVEGKV